MEPLQSTSGSKTSTELNAELVTSLESFVQLYDQSKDDLEQASGCFMQAAVHVSKKLQVSLNPMLQSVLGMCGGALGAVFGGITGGIWGNLGVVGAVTVARDINAAGATVGVVGGILGGVVGGAFSGIIGGSLGVAAVAAGRNVHSVVSEVLWFTVGFVTGGAIGSTYGGSVGAAGGAVGGGFGALHATSAAVYLFGEAIDAPPMTKDPNGGGKQMKREEMMQKTAGDFSESIKLLVDELKAIQELCDKMASSDAVKGVTDQTAKTLAAVAAMEKSVSDSQKAADESALLCCVKEAESECKKIPEELQRTRQEVEKLLVSLKKF